jgi:putative CocE/NonD family hydrolase
MRDGIVLRADVYRPASGRYPVLLQRSAYNKGAVEEPPIRPIGPVLLDAVRAASNGYVVVIEDERGRYESDGDFRVFQDAASDGFDTVEWCAQQPWSTGRVGMYGLSYTGAVQWLAASARPPSLVCILPAMSSAGFWDAWIYREGAFELCFAVMWATQLALAQLPRADDRGAGSSLLESLGDAPAVLARLPVAESLPEIAQLLPSFAEWVTHENDDDYWRAVDARVGFADLELPVLHMSGWYDVFLGGALDTYSRMVREAPEPARSQQRLLIGPWIHSAPPFPSRVGDVEFGPPALVDWDAIQLRWFDRWLKNVTPPAPEPPVRLFVMGENRWRDEWEWPLARTVWTRYYLRSGGAANTRGGDGLLSTEAPGDEPPDLYVYDPTDPTPSIGGTLCCAPTSFPAGAFDQRAVEDRADVLVYTTPPLASAVEVTGPVTVALYACSTAIDTDFTAKLVDVHPDGFARNLCDGIVRARSRQPRSDLRSLAPGVVTLLEINLWATSNVFQPGHRIRLEIASCSFPKWDRNLNTGAGLEGATSCLAEQRVHHNAESPSHIVLPVIPR